MGDWYLNDTCPCPLTTPNVWVNNLLKNALQLLESYNYPFLLHCVPIHKFKSRVAHHHAFFSVAKQEIIFEREARETLFHPLPSFTTNRWALVLSSHISIPLNICLGSYTGCVKFCLKYREWIWTPSSNVKVKQASLVGLWFPRTQIKRQVACVPLGACVTGSK